PGWGGQWVNWSIGEFPTTRTVRRPRLLALQAAEDPVVGAAELAGGIGLALRLRLVPLLEVDARQVGVEDAVLRAEPDRLLIGLDGRVVLVIAEEGVAQVVVVEGGAGAALHRVAVG